MALRLNSKGFLSRVSGHHHLIWEIIVDTPHSKLDQNTTVIVIIISLINAIGRHHRRDAKITEGPISRLLLLLLLLPLPHYINPFNEYHFIYVIAPYDL